MMRISRRQWRPDSAAGLALLAVLLHVTLVPWHAAARQAVAREIALLSADLTVLCHGGRADISHAPPQRIPLEPARDCPVCLGLAGTQAIALLEVASVAAPVATQASKFRVPDATSAGFERLEPRSRGPPMPV